MRTSRNTTVLFVYVVTGIFMGTYAQTLYSAVIYWMPTGVDNQMQFSYHLSWKQQSLGCTSPVCLKAYTVSHMNVQLLGRWAGYSWLCQEGCSGNEVISDLSKLMFAEVSGYLDNKWEAGAETINHTFSWSDATNVRIRFGYKNGTFLPGLGDGYLNLATRNDTRRPNTSPAVAVLPIYRVPLECSLDIDLLPFDGDGDIVRCRWSDVQSSIRSASLNEADCKLAVEATTANGFVSNVTYSVSLYVEDYSETPVKLTHNLTSVSTGPFSRSPVMLTVHVGPPPTDSNACTRRASFVKSSTSNDVIPVHENFSNTTVSFLTPNGNNSMVTVGPEGMLFINTTSASVSGKLGNWSAVKANTTGIVRTCAMLYTSDGVPGDIQCKTLLVGDEDKCDKGNPCARGDCSTLWKYYTCSNAEDQRAGKDDQRAARPTTTSNLGLEVGLPVGLFAVLVGMLVVAVIYLKHVWTRARQVA